jgi:hypothetical protein
MFNNIKLCSPSICFSTKIRRVSQHLRVYSDEVLTKCGGNPQEALSILIENFTSLLNKNGFEADDFVYIVTQTIANNDYQVQKIEIEAPEENALQSSPSPIFS